MIIQPARRWYAPGWPEGVKNLAFATTHSTGSLCLFLSLFIVPLIAVGGSHVVPKDPVTWMLYNILAVFFVSFIDLLLFILWLSTANVLVMRIKKDANGVYIDETQGMPLRFAWRIPDRHKINIQGGRDRYLIDERDPLIPARVFNPHQWGDGKDVVNSHRLYEMLNIWEVAILFKMARGGLMNITIQWVILAILAVIMIVGISEIGNAGTTPR